LSFARIGQRRYITDPIAAASAADLLKECNVMHKIAFLGLSLLVSAQLMAAEPPLRTDLNEQVVMLPVDKNFLGLSIELETTIFKPQGNGPFPLIVLNDGLDFGNPAFQPRARYTVVAEELVARGYVVALPMPRGVGKSTGTMIAASCDIGFLAEKNGKDTVNAIAQLKKLPFIDGNKIIVAGQSYGGLNTLAAASNDIAGLQLAVNFAGGLKYMSKDLTVAVCDWQKSLLEATAKFGASSKVESLWFYGQNDSLFPPDLVVKMRDAYQKGGAKVDLLQYGEFRKDAHGMFGTQVGFDTIWWPKLSAALQAKGLPTAFISKKYNSGRHRLCESRRDRKATEKSEEGVHRQISEHAGRRYSATCVRDFCGRWLRFCCGL
jgi:dienelactone hydrolase